MKNFLNAKEISLKAYKDSNDEIGTVLPITEEDDELNFDEEEKREETLEFEMDEDMFLLYIESYKYNEETDQLIRYKSYQVIGDDSITLDIDENVKTINFTSIGYINKDKVGNIKIKRHKEKVRRI